MEKAGHLDVGHPDRDSDAFPLPTPLPVRETLATQIARDLLRSIRTGTLPLGARLPSEPKLAEMFRVSRNTLREAIQTLIAQRVLESRKGIGTFVSSSGFSTWPVETGLEELTSTTDIIVSAGHEPGCRNYRLERLTGDLEITSALGLAPDASVHFLSRTRLADGQPVILCRDYLPERLIDSTLMTEFDGAGSLFTFLAAKCKLTIAVARTVLKPVLPAPDIAEALGVTGSDPLLLLKQTHFDRHNQPFLYSENYINSNFIGYHVRRMPPAYFSAHPAHQFERSPETS